MLQEQWILASSVYCFAVQIVSLSWMSVGCLWSLKTVKNFRVQLSSALELCNWTPSTSSPLTSIRVFRPGVLHVALWMGERAVESMRGRERRDCSVVVYVSLRSCVGRSALSRHCCCCEKRQNKGLPTLWNPYTFAGLAVLWSRPDGMLLKLTILRSTARASWTGTQWVSDSRLRHHQVLLIFLVLYSRVHLPPFPESDHCW